MRKWVGSLHGGQLVMLLVGILAVGFVVLGLGNYWVDQSNTMYAGMDKATPTDSARYLPLARSWGDRGLALLGAGVIVCLFSLPILWWWFGSRRSQ